MMRGKWFVFTTCAQSLSRKNITLNNLSRLGEEKGAARRVGPSSSRAPMTQEDLQTETEEVLLAPFAPEDWDKVIETNLNACFLLSKFAAQSMVKQRQGWSSTAASRNSNGSSISIISP